MSHNPLKTLAVIQANYTDLLPGETDPEHYTIGPLRRSRHIDGVMIAAADLPRNQSLVDLGRAWGTGVFLGSETDLIDRLLGAADACGLARDAVLVRVLMNRFFLDIDLVDRMIERLRETHSDFVMLPYDFDINFGADVLTLDCLRRVDRALPKPEHAHERFRPWWFIEDHPDRFRAVTFDDVPSYPRDKLQAIRASGLFPTHDYGTYSRFTYELIAQTLKPTDIVVDVACGRGEGSEILARHSQRVYGADFSAAAIADARERQPSNVIYDVLSGGVLNLPDASCTVIVSSGTLECVEDDVKLLRSFQRVLQPGGRLILESSLSRKRPFNAPLTSSVLREYDKEPLLELLAACGFQPVRKYGMNRGMYIGWDHAREAVLVHARRTT